MTKQDNINSPTEPQAEELPEVQNELSKVAADPKQSIFILVVICGIAIYIFFNLFFKSSNSNNQPTVAVPTDVSKPAQAVQNLPSIPKLPEPPKLEQPVAPPPPPVVKPVPPPPPVLPVVSDKNGTISPPPTPSDISIKLVDSDAEKKRREEKRKSSIMLVSGTPTKTPDQIQQEVTFKNRGNMTFVLGKGKIIDAVLETAINSDFGGEVKAIISRDVYSERDKVVLIPKGSKIFGIYSTTAEEVYGRISIIWNRIDLTNGYIINLDAISIDALGRKGEQGRVDNKFKERIANAVLTSAFNIALAHGLDKIVKPPLNSQAAATNIAEATNIQNLALAIYNQTSLGEDVQIAQICATVLNAITDKTSTAYTSMSQACITAQNPIGSNPGQRIQTLMTAVNSAAASLVKTTATANAPTQAQAASKQAFTDITSSIKEMIQQQQFKQTTTINQGSPVKIYVNKDYKFPKPVIQRPKLMQ